jgi:MFS family permease
MPLALRVKTEGLPTRRAAWLNRSTLGIGLASLFSDVGHEMATAAMPVLLASIGANSALLGLIEGLADGAASFAKLASGLYSDRLRRRKPLAVVGYLVTACGMASLALVTQWWHVLIGRVAAWLGRGARAPVRNVLLSEATTPETYGRAFGFERAMDSIGAVIGPLLSLILVALIGLRLSFALTIIPGVMSALLIAALVREREHMPQPHVHLVSGMLSLPGEFRKYLVGVGVAGLGDFANTLLILWATQAWTPILGLARAAQLAMLYYVGYNVVYAASCYVSGQLADRFAKNRVLAIGYSLAIIPALALMSPGTSLVKFAIVFGFSGLYMGVWETLENATAATMLPSSTRGIGFGVLATVNGVGDFLSSAVVGALWILDPRVAMLIVIATSLVGAGIIVRTRPSASEQIAYD